MKRKEVEEMDFNKVPPHDLEAEQAVIRKYAN